MKLEEITEYGYYWMRHKDGNWFINGVTGIPHGGTWVTFLGHSGTVSLEQFIAGGSFTEAFGPLKHPEPEVPYFCKKCGSMIWNSEDDGCTTMRCRHDPDHVWNRRHVPKLR